MDKNEELIKLGHHIAKIRKEKGVTQDNLGYDSEVDPRTISRIEVGEIEPKFFTLLKIAKSLGIRLRDLIDY